ncbi:MAG: UvrD-helicase domain-containing protein [Clostridia bacterium]|nr:UvrD-helicase domain-containing protein [Clostridia bacterium]MBR0421218.1 UvrD-helicase domain-containing protein [Clostridia bacterium]
MDSLAGLNEAQRRAVTTTEGYVRVVAGAGTGKTRTLTRRYGYLVEAGGVSPGHILAVTFTNKAANEMKQRVRSMVGDGDTGYICTFHALGLMILKEDLHTLGWPQNFLVLDEEDKNSLLRTVFEDMGMTLKEMSLHKAADLTDDMKWDLAYVPLLTGESDAPLLELIDREQNRKKQMFYRYLYEQRKIYALDFEDLVDMAVALLRQNQEVREKWARRFEYVMVDEFQDIDGKQYELADMLSSCHKNLFVVGDPDQTIYTWRGADVHFILDFPNRYPGCETVILTENYRSTPQILAAANALIEKNQQRVERQLHAVNGPGPVPPYYHAKDVGAEAKFVVARLKELKAAGNDWRDMAILYRAHYVSRSLEDALLHAKIPYAVYGGMEFYGRKEIKDAICYLRMLAVGDDLAFARVVNEPRRGVGKKRMAFLRSYAQAKGCTLYGALLDNLDHPMIQSSDAAGFVSLLRAYEHYDGMKMSELLSHLLTESGYMKMLKQLGDGDRLDNIAELLQSLEEYETSAGEACTLEDFLSEVALFTDRDREDRKDSVKLMTVHNAKGLEFPHVIVCSLNEGVFPSRKTDTAERMEEERRLCYVACTRAEKSLTLTEAAGVSHEGTARYPSRFLFEMGKENLNYLVELDPTWAGEARRYIRSTQKRLSPPQDPLGPGVRVEHALFGKGTVLEVDRDQQCLSIRFDSGRERTIRFDGPIRLI